MFAKWLFQFIIISGLSLTYVQAKDISVFAAHKTLSLGPKDPAIRDYYISGGADDGFRRGMTVTVVRRLPIHDLSRNRSLGDMPVPVAKMKLIFVQRNMSVGRLTALVSSKSVPTVDYESVMVGDVITLTDGLDSTGTIDYESEAKPSESEKTQSTLPKTEQKADNIGLNTREPTSESSPVPAELPKVLPPKNLKTPEESDKPLEPVSISPTV